MVKKISKEEQKVKQLRALTKGKYQGWKNWTTWAAALYLENEQRSYNAMRNLAKQGKIKSTNRTARAWVGTVPSKEGFRSPTMKRIFVDSVSFAELKDHFKD